MAAQPKQRYTPQEYLALERQAEYKSEYVDGEIFAMAGASRVHNFIALDTHRALDDALVSRPCEVYALEIRVRVSRRKYYYPDVVVACGTPDFEDAEIDTLLNPTVVFEVLSKSTKDYDRGEKAENYRALPSLQELLFVAQDKYHVEHYVRKTGSEWSFIVYHQLDDVLHLPSLGCSITLREVYRRALVQSGTDE